MITILDTLKNAEVNLRLLPHKSLGIKSAEVQLAKAIKLFEKGWSPFHAIDRITDLDGGINMKRYQSLDSMEKSGDLGGSEEYEYMMLKQQIQKRIGGNNARQDD